MHLGRACDLKEAAHIDLTIASKTVCVHNMGGHVMSKHQVSDQNDDNREGNACHAIIKRKKNIRRQGRTGQSVLIN